MPKGYHPRPRIHDGRWCRRRPSCSPLTRSKIRNSVLETFSFKRELYGSIFSPKELENVRQGQRNRTDVQYHSEQTRELLRAKRLKLKISRDELIELYKKQGIRVREIGEIYV